MKSFSLQRHLLLSLRLEGVETLKYRCVCWSPFGKVYFSKQRPWTHAKVRFLYFNWKNQFIDHDTPDTINGFRDSVLVCKMHDCYCTIRKSFEYFYSFSSSDARGKRLQWLARLYENRPLQNAFKLIQHCIYLLKLYNLLIILLLKNNLINFVEK